MPKPTKAKSLIPKTAKNCGQEEEVVRDVVDFFYGKLRKKLESLEEPLISIPVLGTFKARSSKLKRSINTLTILLESDKPESFAKIEKYNLDTNLRDKQQRLLYKVEQNEKFKNSNKNNL